MLPIVTAPCSSRIVQALHTNGLAGKRVRYSAGCWSGEKARRRRRCFRLSPVQSTAVYGYAAGRSIHNAVLAALKAARGFPLCLIGIEWQINFIRNRFCALQSPVYLARHARALPAFARLYSLPAFLAPRYWHATADVPDAVRKRRDFAMPESAASVTSCSASAGQFSTQAGPFSRPAQRSHLCAVAFTFPAATVSERFASYQMDRPPRRIYSQYTLPIDLNAVINVADCAIRAATGAGRIFTMVTGHGTTLLLMFDNRNSMKMVLAQGHVARHCEP